MARIFFVALLVVCLVYVLQASPVPDDPQQTPDVVKQVVDFGHQLLTNATKTFEELANDPNVKKIQEGVQGATNEFLQKVNQEAAKYIPNTQESQAGKA